jgi:hypothetical protein
LTGYYRCKRKLIYLDVVQSVSIVTGEVVDPRCITDANLYKKYATTQGQSIPARRRTTVSVV